MGVQKMSLYPVGGGEKELVERGMELKPCPFCGGEAYMARTYRSYIALAKHDDNCPLFVRPIPYDTHWATREAACAAWNRRVDGAERWAYQ